MDIQTRGDEAILNAIKGRYQCGTYQTWAADVLLVLRPPADSNKDANRQVLQSELLNEKNSKNNLIHSLAKATHEALLSETYEDLCNQTVVLRGISGSGKTELCKNLVKILCRTDGNSLNSKISQVYTVLEAFGNARTSSNTNSSRFTSTYTLSYKDGRAVAMRVSQLLLEPWRVVDYPEGQSNFHVFYYVVAGHNSDNLSKNPHRLLRDQSLISKQDIDRHKEKYHSLVKAVKLLGFSAKEQSDMMLILVMILTLGNVTFRRSKSGEAVLEEESKNILKTLAEGLGLDEEELGECLCCKTVCVSQEEVTKMYSRDEAEDFLDFLLSTIYGRLFSWLVKSINDRLTSGDASTALRYINVVDFPGHENVGTNSFEQFMINVSDDVLHYSFAKNYSILTEEEYVLDGLEWIPLILSDSAGLIHTLLPEGHLLDSMPKVFREDKPPVTEAKMLASYLSEQNRKFFQLNSKNPNVFALTHYGNEKVEYDIRGWSQKMKTFLPTNTVTLLKNSENPLLSLLFKANFNKRGVFQSSATPEPQRRNHLLALHFKSNISNFLRTFATTTTTYVCCIRPTSSSSSSSYDGSSVNKQFEDMGLIDIVRSYKNIHQLALTFEEFIEKYSSLLTSSMPSPSQRISCTRILNAFLPNDSWKMGQSKVFLKQQHFSLLNKATRGSNNSQCPKATSGSDQKVIEKTKSEFAKMSPKGEKPVRGEAPSKTQGPPNLAHSGVKMNIQAGQPATFSTATPSKNNLPPKPNGLYQKRSRQYVDLDFSKWEKTQETQQNKNDSDSDYEWTNLPANKEKTYGEIGARNASVKWFLSTQAQELLVDGGLYTEWFHGIISRGKADTLLADKPMGCFLVRLSESRLGFVLSFKDKKKCRHYIIDEMAGGRFKVMGEKIVHSSLASLVDYYKKNKLSNWKGHLKTACPQIKDDCAFDELSLAAKDVQEIMNRPRIEPSAPPLSDSPKR